MATYIRGICELYLDAPPSAWDSFFNGSASAPVDAFCGGGAKAGATLFVWSATDVKEVMREVVTSREVMVEVDDEGAEDGASSPGFASEEKKAEDVGGAAGGDGGGGAPTPGRRTVKRVVEEVTTQRVPEEVVRLCASLSAPAASGSSVAYFLKTAEGALAGADADTLAGALEFGVLAGGGDLLGALQGMVKHVYLPLLEPQLAVRGGLEDGGGGGGGDGSVTEGEVGGEGSSVVSGYQGGGTGTERSGGGASTLRRAGTVRSGAGGGSTVFSGGGDAPAAAPRIIVPAPLEAHRGVAGAGDNVRSEFRAALSRYSAVLTHTAKQVGGVGVRLEVPPEAAHIASPAAAAGDEDLRALLVVVVEGWTRDMLSASETPREDEKGARPLSEVEFWRNRSGALGQLREQLAAPSVAAVLRTLELAGERCMDAQRAAEKALAKAAAEARDNVRFLATVERHFKTLATGSMAAVVESLPSLLNGLRMMWAVSRGYSSDDTLVPLLRRIVGELCERVVGEVGSLRALLRAAREAPADVLSVLRNAQRALDGWKEHFMTTRERIELMGGDEKRWDFDRRSLFERSEHMALVLADISHVVEATAQLSTFFGGNELRTLGSNTAELDAIKRVVKRLTAPFSHISYNFWEKARASRWRAEMNHFSGQVEAVEDRTQAFIASAFVQLRSAEGAFDFLAKLATIPMRDSLRKLLDRNAINVLVKQRAELTEAVVLFAANKDAPPVYKNCPPVAGAIAWANALYLRQKKPLLRIRAAMPGLLNDTPEGAALKVEYLAFARSVDAYVKALYTGWCELAKKRTAELLRRPVLGPALLSAPLSPAETFARIAGAPLGSAASAAAAAAGADKAAALARRSLATASACAAVALSGDAALLAKEPLLPLLPPPPYAVNFSPELAAIIKECKQLDAMGFALPEAAMAVALAESTLTAHVARLISVLESYTSTLSGLTPVECNLLQSQLAALRAALRPGFSPLNWNSLHIGAFCGEVNRALQDFVSVLTQVRKSCAVLEEVVAAIEGTSLVAPALFEGQSGLVYAEVYDTLEKYRSSTLRALVERYYSVKPVMLQIEGLVAGTDTCASPRLAEFYRYWERRFYNALVRMTVQSMTALQGLLDFARAPGGGSAPEATRAPLVRCAAFFQPVPEVSFSPDRNFLTAGYIKKFHEALLYSGAKFTRWMDGTCLPVATSTEGLAASEPAPDFSYMFDISSNAEVQQALLRLFELNNVRLRLNSQKNRWEGFGKAYNLWQPRRPEGERRIVESALQYGVSQTKAKEGWSTAEFSKYMTRFQQLAETAEAQPSTYTIRYVRLDCSALKVGIKAQCLRIKADFGRLLKEVAMKKLGEITSKFAEISKELDAKPTDLPSLKAVLGAVAAVKEMRCEMEIAIAETQDRFATLALHGFAGEGGEASPGVSAAAEAAARLPAEWQALVDFSLTKDARLIRYKEKFREVTREDALAMVEDCDALLAEFQSAGPSTPGVTLVSGAALMASFVERLAEFNKRREGLSNAERLFGLPNTRYEQLSTIREATDAVTPLYALYGDLVAFKDTNAATPWSQLDVASLQKGAEDMAKRATKLKDLKSSPVYPLVSDEVLGFRDALPLISSLKNPAMKERHWDAIGTLTGVKIPPIKSLTLGAIFAMHLARFNDAVEDICTQAKGELKIEKDLKAISEKWTATAFRVEPYKKNGEVRGSLIRPDETLRQFLDDDLMNLSAISGSRFVPIFAAQVSEWDKKLNLVSECVELWLVVQTKWAYLEGIFIGSEDIKQQLPEETKRFAMIHKEFTGIMAGTAKVPNVVEACCEPGRFALLGMLGERLDACQKSLSEYLYTKRNAFPRFFFVSDDELLSVLGSSDPASIQVHLLKLFDNVKTFHFKTVAGPTGSKLCVAAMGSSEGESYDMRNPSPVEGAVETWMTAAEKEMQASLHAISKEGVFNYASTVRTQWIADVLGMVAVAGSQIWWTWETEDTFRRVRTGDKYAMKVYAERQTAQLLELVSKVRQNIGRQERAKVNTLLIVDIHARDIIDAFVRDSVLDAREFAWESQLRFYWDKGIDDIAIRQCTGSLRYGFEYMGLNGRLVITPLTDRCYMTLTQGLTFNLGGAPAGPAGTGKTETTKDLAKNLAIPCFVTNCGEGLDFRAMGAIFSGLAQVGAWGCFDEFNRINIEVLSVVAAQVRAIQNALNYKRATADIGFGDIKLNPKVGIFITMNPGYAGRTELPDNLKALFRPVTMIVPDLLQICEIMLFSEGFEGARVLAKKMTTLYRLSKEQLSKQYHYDFGMRALKSVLVMAGGLKREFSDMNEELVLMRSLRDSNLPKFVFDDVPLFKGLIVDLFPGLDCPRVSYPQLKAAVEAELEKLDMRHDDDEIFNGQVDAVIQLYEVILTRHTSMVVGPTGGGKSVCISMLQKSSLVAFDKSIKTNTLNPKAQTVDEMYGHMDPVSRDWTDGILSKLFRAANDALPPGKENEVRWIIFDGDVDALWVENMNSVMDDNKLLTLPNGERIRLQTYCKLLIEVFDLQYASPATISRCGMTYMDPKNLGFRPYYVRWAKQRCGARGRTTEAGFLKDLYDRYVPQMLLYLLEGDTGKRDPSTGQAPPDAIEEALSLALPGTSNLTLTKQLCTMLDAVLPPVDGPEPEEPEPVEAQFLFALTWSVGALVMGTRDRERFSAFLTKLAQGAAAVLPPFSSGKGKGGEDASGTLWYDFFYDVDTRKWCEWASRVPEYEPPKPFEFSKILVPTTDNVLFSWLCGKLLGIDRPVLFVGDSGTAKTTTIAYTLGNLDKEKFNQLLVNFSSRTTSQDVQKNIEASTDKRSGSNYGPPMGKRLMVFVDDLNMPKIDKYGTQQPVALLHFLVGRGNMYDLGKDLNVRNYKDMQYVCGMQPPGGGKNPVDPRFLALFNSFCLTPPTPAVLAKIYGSIITKYLDSRFAPAVSADAAKVTGAMLALYNVIVEKLPPTPAKFHYIFNLRDLGRVYEGMCTATPDAVATGADLVRLWRNECLRVFADRLITSADEEFVSNAIKEQVSRVFPDAAATACVAPSLYGDFSLAVGRLTAEKDDPRVYKDMGAFADVGKIMDAVLEAHNLEKKPMTLVLFEYALDHVTRLLRILRVPRGNALLVGVGGSGKQSLTRLAAFTACFDLFEITLVRGYSEVEFREDLKNLYKRLNSGPIVFLFTDAHVVEEGFLELINNMLNVGMVPALFESDERDGLVNAVRAEVKARGMTDTKETCWSYYVNKCRANLHLVLAMSPSGDTLRRRCRAFPGLVSACVIDWYFPWPSDALARVAQFFLREETLPEELRGEITAHCVHVHTSVVATSKTYQERMRRINYVTPKNYLDFIANYRAQLGQQRTFLTTRAKRLESGLAKLIEAATSVAALSVELKASKIVVDAKTVEVEAMIKDIGERQVVANEQKAKATVKEAELTASAIVIKEESGKAQTALDAALPALEAAADALNNLDAKDIGEVKGFANPPQLVKAVCLAVQALKPNGDENPNGGWAGAKAMMSNSQFLNNLKNYKKDDIKPAMNRQVLAIFDDPGEGQPLKEGQELTVECMKLVSKAGSGLLQWVVAIKQYYVVARDVDPLRKKVADMEKAQAIGEKELSDINTLLGKLSAELADLDVKYRAAAAELADLSEKAATMERRLVSASKLIDGLASERVRWTADVERLGSQLERTTGDCLLAASFLSYLGPFTIDYRQNLLNEVWQKDVLARKVPVTQPMAVEEQLTTDATVQKWNAEGLPSDPQSIWNGILTTRGSRFPLCIDPQQQAVAWIKSREGANLQVANFTDADFMQPLKLAIQYGKPFLFEAVDETIDPMIDVVLEKLCYFEGSQRMINIDDKAIAWDDNFRLFLTSKLANPHYSPEVMGKTQVINFCVTLDGLEGQLLNVVVGHERPDLEASWKQLVEEMSASALLLESLEESLLRNLAQSTGNILDNEELIATLESAKSKSVEITQKLVRAKSTKEDISKARAAYQAAAKRGSILFFVMAGLVNVNKMYELSLSSFLVVFRKSLNQAKKGASLEARLKNIVAQMTNDMYDYTCLGIFERHKLMFSFQMTLSILDGEGQLVRSELDFFLKGDTSIEMPKDANPFPWLSATGWKDLCKLGGGLAGSSSNEALTDLLKHVRSKEGGAEWRAWYDLEAPETVPLPGGFSERLGAFPQLVLLRCFRPDRVYNGVKRYVMGVMGETYVQPPVLDYSRIFHSASPTTPVVFILSPGADPQADIQALGLVMGFTVPTKFRFLAMGQGQAPKAEEMLLAGAQRGYWVLLQNTHLLISWLSTLEKMLNNLGKPHPDFRLWMTTDPTDKFPLGILQRSLKVVTEPPDGLKLNMRSSYAKLLATAAQEAGSATPGGGVDDCPHPAYRPLIYGMVFLHGVLLERRKYGRIGFNVSYDFNDSDFNISRRALALYLTKAFQNGDDVIPWGSLRYLIGEVNYGGRVSDSFDRRTLTTYLEEYMGDFLFDENNKFFFAKGAAHNYDLPPPGGLKNYADAVEVLPLTNGPAVFGLHPNAEINMFTDAAKSMWTDLIDMQPRTGGGGAGGGLSREDYIASVVRDLTPKIPPPEDIMNIKKRLTEGGTVAPSPTSVVLLQELERWNRLVGFQASSLVDLSRALVGEIGMSEELEEVGTALFNGVVPGRWLRLAPATMKPLGSWMAHFKGRHAQYQAWIEKGDPVVIWLSGLHIPESYLTALVQMTCRRQHWALDRSTLFTVTTRYTQVSQVPGKLEDGCYVNGLFLEGAGWDVEKACLRRQEPKVLVVELPILQVLPIEAARLQLAGTFRTPVYVTQARRNAMGVGLVFEADLATEEHLSLWVLQGVALVVRSEPSSPPAPLSLLALPKTDPPPPHTYTTQLNTDV
jgi:dynein heavy chain